MARYQIWDKSSPVITPIGEVLTAEQWKDRYPVARLESVTIVCAAGEINGAFFGTLGQMKQMAENEGADFSDCSTNEEILARIEEFEASRNVVEIDDSPTAEERIAAALEYQNLLSM